MRSYLGKVKKIIDIGGYHYGICLDDVVYLIAVQRFGDTIWLVKEEEFFTPESAIEKIKAIAKEHYDAIKLEAGR